MQVRDDAHMHNKRLLSTRAAADIVGCSVATISRYARLGDLPTAEKDPGLRGARWFRRSDVRALARSLAR